MKRRQAKKTDWKAIKNEHWHPYTDSLSAYLDGDFPALHDLEMRQQYGDDWDNVAMNDRNAPNDSIWVGHRQGCDLPIEAEELKLFESYVQDDDEYVPF